MQVWQKSEYYNDLALSEDPDYAKALYRNILILEKKGLYTRASQMAQFCVTRFDYDLEEQEN